MGSFDAARCVTTFGLDFTMHLLWSIREGARTLCWQSWFWYPCRCETRVRAQSQVILCSLGIGNVFMAYENRIVWFEFTWWHEGPSGPKVCGWPFGICNESGWHYTNVGGVGDFSGPSWFNTEHVENKNFDYTSSTRKFLADKWWGDGGNTG